MKPYVRFFQNTGFAGDVDAVTGRPHWTWIEELYNDTSTTAFNNHIRMALCVAVKSQVAMLVSLREAGRLPQHGGAR